MPPRIPSIQRLGTFNLCLRPAPPSTSTSLFPPLTQSASISQKEKKRLAKQDPYRWAQAQQRKAAHLKRREGIEAGREALLGDPVQGKPTAFVQSFDSAGQEESSNAKLESDGQAVGEQSGLPTSKHLLNHLLTTGELDSAVRRAYELAKPLENTVRDAVDPVYEKRKLEEHEAKHKKAVEALNRITSLENASSRDRRHANIRRCIETFGRHVTDEKLENPVKPLARGQEREEAPVRGGPDTGSSEVQIAILTMKIRKVQQELAKGRGYKDKIGKRDLRLLVHRRQRLLQYMERKERGSGRWQHMIETLGLTSSSWKGQITL